MQEGTTVRVSLPTSEQTLSSAMRAFHGVKTTIRSSVHIKGKGGQTVYTLNGCKSDFGIHYLFLAEWLIPIEEGEKV